MLAEWQRIAILRMALVGGVLGVVWLLGVLIGFDRFPVLAHLGDSRRALQRSLVLVAIIWFCFAAATVAAVQGRRLGHPAGGAMLAMGLRSGGPAFVVASIVMFVSFERAKSQIVLFAIYYIVGLISDTAFWLWEIKRFVPRGPASRG